VVTETLQLSVYDIAAFEGELDLPDLAERLKVVGVPVLAQSNRQFVLQADWTTFLRDAICAYTSVKPVDRFVKQWGTPARLPATEHDVTVELVEPWGETETKRLNDYPPLRQLVDNFTVAALQRFKVPCQQHTGTRTFIFPGRRVGLTLRARSLFVYRIKNGLKRGIDVRSEADFEQALNWIETA
jgi:hypothetical protein